MSKLNKIITNQPVVLTEEEVNNLSETLSAVRTAGGGEGGHLYTGDNKYIGVDNGNYKIKFLDNAAEKLESISSKLDKTEAANTYLTSADAQTLYQTKEAMSDYAKKTEIPDSISAFDDTESVIYSYINPATAAIQQQLNGKQNKLKFDLNDKGEISAIGPEYGTTTALAGANGITGDYYSASNPSGFINSTQAETQILEKHYLTEASGDSLYVPIPQGLSDGQYYAMTTSSWKVIQGAGDVSGISTVAHDDTLTGNGNNENLGVDITKIQTKLTDAQIQNITDVTTLKTASAGWDKVSDKLDTTDFTTYTATTAPSTYQPIGNYLSSNALEGYATTALLDTISSKIENDIPTTVAQLTDSGNYYTKSETSGAIELSTEFGKYALKSEIPTVPTKVSDLTDSGNYYQKTETSSKNEITNALNTKVDKPSSIQTGKLVYDGDTSAWVTLPAGTTTIVQGQGSVTANYDSSNSTYTVSLLASAENALNDVKDKIDTTAVAQTYQTKSDMANYLTTSDAANTYQPIGNYAPESVTATVNILTAASAGWNEVTAKLDKSIYSNASGNWEASYNVLTAYSAAGKWLTAHQNLDNYYTKTQVDSTFASATQLNNYLTTAQYQTDSAKYVTNSNVTTQDANYVMTTTGWKVLTLPGGGMTAVIHDETLTGLGNDDNSKLGVVWSALSGNTINSALSAGSATSALSAENAESARYTKLLKNASKSIEVNDITALQHWASSNSSTWDSVSAKLGTAQYANDSATFVTSSNASISAAGEQYALTTTGWAKVQAGGGSTVTIDTTNNEIKDGTSAVSAMSYVVNPNNAYWKPQRSCVCTEAEISTMAGYANGQGMLFFVVSGHNQ